MTPTRARLALAALCVAAATGCSANVAATADASTTSTRAYLSFERSAREGEPASARAHASARFVRVQAGADEAMAARLVGADLPLPALETCAPLASLGEDGMPLATLGPVDLIDAGEVALETAEGRDTLAVRAFPDVVDLVSGVVYTTRDGAALGWGAPGALRLRAAGSWQIPAIALDVEAPAAPASARVGERALDDAAAVPAGESVRLSWEPGSGTDSIYIDVTSPASGLRCAVRDTGETQLPAEAFPPSGDATVALHRVRRASHAQGSLPIEVRFDAAVTGVVRVEPGL